MNKTLPFLTARDPVVLVVDDQEANVRIVGTVLAQSGFEVVPALSGAQALERAAQAPPDLVLLDMLMPGMDGFEVARRLREDVRTAGVPIIFLTAAHEREHLVRAFEAGAVDYVTKPFVPGELLARVRTHVELKLTRDHLGRIAREREDLATIVAHDLKNPLSGIRFSAQLLTRSLDEPERARNLLDMIESSAEHALNFIQHYLERRAEGELMRKFAREPVSLGDIMQRVADRFATQAQVKGLALRLEVPERLVAAADAMALEQVIENLVSNAIKFSPGGGEISLACGRGRPGRVRCMVLDRGPGVSPTDQARLFRRYVRLTAQPTGNETSTGLGLALAKQDVGQMDGELWYEDRPGGGAVFAFELPLHS